MKRTITATYRDGVFYPDEPCDLPEGAMVEVTELANGIRPPLEADPAERRKILSELVKSMTANLSRLIPLGSLETNYMNAVDTHLGICRRS